jgi:hypothetical protein
VTEGQVEGCTPHPRRRDTGLTNLPLHDLAQNIIWCAVVALAYELSCCHGYWGASIASRVEKVT